MNPARDLPLLAAWRLSVPARPLRALARGDHAPLRVWLAEESALRLAAARRDAYLDLATLDQLGARIVTPDDADWPAGFAELRDPPAFLSVRGPLPPSGVAIVGARDADMPNATVMLVEDADRYGISQLHQLRGRIGRGAHASICLLFGAKESPRLRALAAHTDGFKLAEIDLQLRGEGELVGTRQHGLAQFRVAELPRDASLLEAARVYAEEVVAVDPALSDPEHTLLADALVQAYGAEAQSPIRA